MEGEETDNISKFEEIKNELLKAKSTDEKVQILEQLASAIADISDKEKVEAPQLMLLPLHRDNRSDFRKIVLVQLQNMIKNVPEESKKFVIGGIVMELDKMSKTQQSSAGSRMAQETSIFWLKIALLVAKSCPSDAIPKFIQIIARLTNAGFRGKIGACIEHRFEAKIKQIVEMEALKTQIEKLKVDDTWAIVLHAAVDGEHIMKMIESMVTDKKQSQRYQIYGIEYAARHLDMDKLKVLITVLEKQMLRAAEVGCPRLSALVQGASHNLDLSPFVKQISQSLVKVILGTNEENIQIAKKAFQTMIKSCKDEEQLCKVADYLKAVYGGKEGKITQNQQKIDILQLYKNFESSSGCGLNLAKNVANALVTIQEKESTEQVLSVLYKSLQACLAKIEKSNEIDQILITAIAKASKATSSAGLFGLVSSLYPLTTVSADLLKIAKGQIEKIEKNSAGGAAMLKLLADSGDESANVYISEMLKNSKSNIFVPKVQKAIISSDAALFEFSVFSIIVLEKFPDISKNHENLFCSMISKQLLRRDQRFSKQLSQITNNSDKFCQLGDAFYEDVKSGLGNEQSITDGIKEIVGLSQRLGKPEISQSLIKCINFDASFSSTKWRSLVLERLPKVEKCCRIHYLDNLKLSDSILDNSFCLELGTLASASKLTCTSIIKEIMTAGIQENIENIRKVKSDDIAISLHQPGELWNTSIMDKHAKKLDKNSKNYEEEKWAMEQQAKLDAKKGIVKLTKEQIEAKKKELEKESEIREKFKATIICFRNSIKILTFTIGQLNETKLLEPLKNLLSELAEILFDLLGTQLFDVDALNMLRSLARLISESCCPGSWCDGIVSFSARLSKSEDLEGEWKKEILDVGLNRLQYATPTRKTSEFFAILISEFCCLSLETSAASTLETLWGIYKKLPLRQLSHVIRRLIHYLTNATDSNTIDNANDILIAIAGNINQRGLNTMNSAVDLIHGMESEAVECQTACLAALNKLEPQHGYNDETTAIEDYLAHRVYTMRHSDDKSLRKLAKNVMSHLNLFPAEDCITRLCNDSYCGVAHLQLQAAFAAGEYTRSITIDEEAEDYALPEDATEENANKAVNTLIATYHEEYELSKPRFDTMGRPVKNIEDRSLRRVGISKTIHAILEAISNEHAEKVFNLLIPTSLNDYTPAVAEEMLHVGMKAIDIHGTVLMTKILPLFENYLQAGKSAGDADGARQSVVVLLGRLAQHLPPDDKRVKPIVAQLIAALSVPSEKVQRAVALCLPALVPAIKGETKPTIKGLISLMLDSQQYGERRGGAHGLAGIIKGLGLLSIKHLDILETLSEAMQDKKANTRREGALFGLGAISHTLGRLFEPYVIKVLPTLLEAVGDGNFGVRDAAEEASQYVMSSLSAHGVKLVLPHLLKALESDQWRTKVGSVELLGSMAHCSPKQLSNCLPQIVPYLAEVLTDSHPKVGKAGRQALGQIGKVIQNPEIKLLTPFLLDGLADPANKISPALSQLNSTRFVHHIDAASLALIMPIIQRSFNERSAETRKLAAQIIGGMCNRNQALCSGSDFTPYLGNIMPGLRVTLVDPVPDVRATAAKAIGNIVSITPSDNPVTSELLPWLKSLLISVSSAVDRSGAAQGLAEVLLSKGPQELERIMPQMLEEASDITLPPTVRDGYCMAFIYFPVVFKTKFSEYVPKVIPALLANLADENEYLRDTALKAGKKIIQLFADTAIALLLPELEQGLLDENWRIRYSSVQLLGDLLFHITGVSGKQGTEGGTGEDNFGTNEGQKMIQGRLGALCYNRVLAGMYMCRSDVALLVRQSALHVWKLVVYNTARTVREVLPTLIQLILQNLASEFDEKRQIASRTLGDLVKKLGERILPKLMPILNKGLESDSEEQRQGVCIGLTEVIQAASKDMVMVMTQQLGPTIRSALSDESEYVRSSAADTFEMLHNKLGVQAIEEIIPHLLDLLQASEEEKTRALDGLRRILAAKGRAVLPAVLPKLTMKPVNTATLAFLASAAGEHLSRYVDQVMAALIDSLVDNECSQSVLDDCSILIEAVDDEHGASLLLSEIVESSKSDNPMTKQAAACLMKLFIEKTEADYEEYYGVLFREIIRLLSEPAGSPILEICWTALQTMVKTFDSAQLQTHLGSVRQALSFVRKECDSDGHLPGFGLDKKGINCILPIFKEGILGGSADHKESTALCLQEVILMTPPLALKPSVVGLAGPLIRILGDRYGSQVKCPLLQTLELLLKRNGAALKAFLPQLQTTFLKATHDETREVRIRAAEALGKLAGHHARIEPLVTELRKVLSDNMETSEMFETYAYALRLVMENGGAKVSQAGKESVLEMMSNMKDSDETQSRLCSAGVVAATIIHMENAPEVLEEFLNISGSDEEISTKLAVLGVVTKLKPDLVIENSALLNCLLVGAKSDEPTIIEAVVILLTYLLNYYGINNIPNQVISVVKKIVQMKNNGILVKLANAISWSQNENDAANVSLLPFIIIGAGHGTMSVKNAYETCLVVCTRIRHHEYGIEPLVNGLTGKDKSWLADFCQVGGKLRRLALTAPIVNDPDQTLLVE